MELCGDCSTGLWLPSMMPDIDVLWTMCLRHDKGETTAKDRQTSESQTWLHPLSALESRLFNKDKSHCPVTHSRTGADHLYFSTHPVFWITWGKIVAWKRNIAIWMFSSQQIISNILVYNKNIFAYSRNLPMPFMKFNMQLALSGWGCCHRRERHFFKIVRQWEVKRWCLLSLGPRAVSLLCTSAQGIRSARSQNSYCPKAVLPPRTMEKSRWGTSKGERFLYCNTLIRHHGKVFPSV